MSYASLELMSSVPEARGAAYSDAAGNVIEQVGQLEADTVCAVAAMSMATLDEVGALLGLGPLQGWSIVSQQSSLYVHRRGGGFVAVVGPPSKNPEGMLKKLG